ncbi:aspartyl aminopeptidase [Purpureocillium lavendulum]|uniref:deuterolysin n=1 Tax=Purpureocillium lavendulum TaxID=1247861 RepID=A0AB34G5I0_9HYPO|nr:aspartyl aminopeptidase [Purpureocillium lavendulum]
MVQRSTPEPPPPLLPNHAEPLVDVTLRVSSGTVVTATIKNKGTPDVRVLRQGSLLDRRPIRKVDMSYDGQGLPFIGMSVYTSMTDLNDGSWENLPAGGSLEATFDITEMYNVTRNGTHVIKASGRLYVMGANTPLRPIVFESDALEVDTAVPVLPSALVTRMDAATLLSKRRLMGADHPTDCLPSQINAITAALYNCISTSRRARTAALCGRHQRMQAFFSAAHEKARDVVADTFSQTEHACNDACGKHSRTFCDNDGADAMCDDETLAVTFRRFIWLCSLFFAKEGRSGGIYHNDQASIMLHEALHLVGLPRDYAYGWEALLVPAEKRLLNPDNFVGFARHAMYDPKGDEPCPAAVIDPIWDMRQ